MAGIGIDVSSPKGGLAEINFKSIVVKAKETKSIADLKKWEDALIKEEYDHLSDSTISELSQGLRPEDNKLMLFCETFKIDLASAMEELDKLQEQREAQALEKAKERQDKQKNKNRNKNNANDDISDLNLLGYISREEYSAEDILKKYNKNKSMQQKFERKDNHMLLIDSEFEIDSAIKVDTNEFDAYLTIGEIGEMWARGEVGYNPEIQRGTKFVGDKEKAIFKQSKVDKIVEKIIAKKYIKSTIYICLYDDGTVKAPQYDDDGTLLFKGKKIIIEGQHRCHAFCKVWVDKLKGEHPELNLNQLVNVKFFFVNDIGAKEAFVQLGQTLAIPKSRLLALETNHYSELIRVLNNESEIKNQINMVSASTSGRFLTSINVMREALKMAGVSLPSSRSVKREAEYLKEFLEVLVDEFPEYFSEEDLKYRKELKKTKMLNQSIMWYALIVLAYYDKENFEENVKKLHNVDFTRTNEIWSSIQAKATGEEYDLKIVNENSAKYKVVEILFNQLGYPVPELKSLTDDNNSNTENVEATV